MKANNSYSTGSRPPLGSRFLTFWVGQTVSAIGSMVAGIGLAVWVYVETGNAMWLGLLAGLSSLPPLLVSPLLPLVDRFPRRAVIVVADTVAASGTAISLVLAAAGALEVWHLVVAGFVANVGTAIQLPAFQAAIPALVEPAALGRANGLNQLGPAMGIVLGPIIATPLIAWKGIAAVLVVDVVTFGVAIACTLAVRFAEHREPMADTDDGSWRPALRWLTSDGRPLAVLLVSAALVNLCLAFFNVATVSVATAVGGTARSGLVFGLGGIAMVVGSLLLGRHGVPTRRGRALGVSLSTISLGLVVIGLRPTFAVVVIGAAIALGVVPVVSATASTVFHERVPASMQGRIFGLRVAASRSLDPIGAIIAGLVIAHLAEPTMAPGGLGADTVGRVIGVGSERGAALVIIAAGLLLAVVAWWLRRTIGDTLDATTTTHHDAALTRPLDQTSRVVPARRVRAKVHPVAPAAREAADRLRVQALPVLLNR